MKISGRTISGRQKLTLIALLTMAAILFFTGINWGLPSRASDRFLFAGRSPWTGKQIMDLAEPWDESGPRGADIAMHPLGQRDQPIVLNDTDARRAEIVRRYRLYSSQPDEMITFRSLSRMKPGKFDLDPRLYQYGGLWIYPVGGLLKLASLVGLVTLKTDLAFYLDHPEAFARFYLVARTYSAIWGMLGVLAVYAVGREWTGSSLVGATAAAVFAAAPVVIDLAHEAKPHLPGTVLTLTTIWAAMRYVRTGLARWWIAAGIAAGASVAMVLTGYVAFAVLGTMTLLRPMAWADRIRVTTAAGLIGVATFTLFDPYLPFNLLLHREVLHSNVGNYGTFYQPYLSATALWMTVRSLVAGLSVGPAILGILGIAAVIVDRKMGPDRKLGFLLLAPAVLVLVQFVLLADGKPAEYARFAVTLDVILIILAAELIYRIPLKDREKILASLLLVVVTLYFGMRYDINFVADVRTDSTRNSAAITIEQHRTAVLDVWSEPAPYCLPPADLFDQQIVLLPRGSTTIQVGAIAVRPVDEPGLGPAETKQISLVDESLHPLSPISWANKPFQISASLTADVSSNRPHP